MLTGLELMFMGVTRSNSFLYSLFSALQVLLSHLWEKKKRGEEKKRREGGKKEIEKERKEGRGNKERSQAR